jgi:LuxR family maltose regulon positive regulatory protein
MAYVGLAQVQCEWNDLDSALHSAREGIELTEAGGFTSVLLSGYARLVEVCLARGDMAGACRALEKADQLAKRHDYPQLAGALAKLRMRYWVAQGNLASVSQWLRDHGSSPGDELDFAQEAEWLAVVRALLALNQPASAQGALSRLREVAERDARKGSLIEILTLQSLACHAQGDVDHGLSLLARALVLAEPEGYVRTFVDEGEAMARLLARFLAAKRTGHPTLPKDIAPSYVNSLLEALGASTTPASPAAQALVEPLTARELDVLRLIAAGLSNAEIAQELVIAVSTVKSHINHIYGKLGAKSRTHAVAKAQTLDLL